MNNISTPLLFPKIVPNPKWNEIWESNAELIRKVSSNHNAGQAFWKGFDIYVKPDFDIKSYTGYDFKNINCPEIFPEIFNNLDLLPIEIFAVRAMSSMTKVMPHSDCLTPMLSVRTLLCDDNPKSTFYYQFNNKVEYQQLPETTNTWMYWDHKSKHGTDFYQGHRKILLAYYGKMKSTATSMFDENVIRYKDFAIYD